MHRPNDRSGRALERRQISAVLDALRRIVQALRLTARGAERRHGISGAQLFVLHQLADSGTCSINELADRTFTHQSSVSTVVSRLVASGHVMRRAAPGDGRRAEVLLTRAGRALLRRAPEPAQAHLIDGVRRLAARDRQALARVLTSLAGEMQSRDGTPPLFFEEHGAHRTRTPRPARA